MRVRHKDGTAREEFVRMREKTIADIWAIQSGAEGRRHWKKPRACGLCVPACAVRIPTAMGTFTTSLLYFTQ